MKLRVLVADDETDVRDYLAAMLEAWGHEIVGSACDGEQLVAMAVQYEPDLIISDQRMPKATGDQAIRQINLARLTPSILISASFPASFQQAHNQVLLTKPITKDDLQRAVSQAMPHLANGQGTMLSETQE